MYMCTRKHMKEASEVCTRLHTCGRHDAGVYMLIYKTQRMCMSAGTGKHIQCIQIFVCIRETPVYV